MKGIAHCLKMNLLYQITLLCFLFPLYLSEVSQETLVCPVPTESHNTDFHGVCFNHTFPDSDVSEKDCTRPLPISPDIAEFSESNGFVYDIFHRFLTAYKSPNIADTSEANDDVMDNGISRFWNELNLTGFNKFTEMFESCLNRLPYFCDISDWIISRISYTTWQFDWPNMLNLSLDWPNMWNLAVDWLDYLCSLYYQLLLKVVEVYENNWPEFCDFCGSIMSRISESWHYALRFVWSFKTHWLNLLNSSFDWSSYVYLFHDEILWKVVEVYENYFPDFRGSFKSLVKGTSGHWFPTLPSSDATFGFPASLEFKDLLIFLMICYCIRKTIRLNRFKRMHLKMVVDLNNQLSDFEHLQSRINEIETNHKLTIEKEIKDREELKLLHKHSSRTAQVEFEQSRKTEKILMKVEEKLDRFFDMREKEEEEAREAEQKEKNKYPFDFPPPPPPPIMDYFYNPMNDSVPQNVGYPPYYGFPPYYGYPEYGYAPNGQYQYGPYQGYM